jgi:PAS domain S-box-containing protein
MDQKGVIRFVNAQTESLFGYSRDQLISRPVGTLIPEPLWEIYTANRDQYFADPRTRSMGLEVELVGLHQDGSEFPINVSMAHIDTGDVLLVITAIADVTKREAAVKNAELIAAIVESSDDAIIGSTLTGILTSWNPAAVRMFGYSAKEIIGRPGSLLTPDDRAAEINPFLARVKEGEPVEHVETMLARKDGSVVPVSITVSPIRDENGVVVGACGVHRDVTGQRKAFETAQRMAAIVEHSDDAIISRGLDDAITSWNPAAERIFGYSSEEIIGKSASILVPEGRAGELEAIMTEVKDGNRIEHLETVRFRKDGTAVPVSLTVSQILDEGGVLVGASTIVRDLTGQEHAAIYARSLVEAALDPLVTISPDGKINDVNEATVKATGIPRDHLIGTDFSSYFTEPDKAHEAYERAFTRGSVTDYPLTVRHRDGTLTDLAWSASVYRDVNGNVLGVLAVAHDMTEQKRAFEVAQRMAAIVQSTDDAIIGRTLGGVITSWNPAAEAMFGYSSQEIIGQPIDRLAPLDRRDEDEPVAVKIRAGQAVEHLQTTRVRKDGTMFPVSLTVSPICDENGAAVGASVICRDMTQQQHAANYARSLIETGLDPLVTISPEGKINDVNEASARVTGIPREALLGTDFSGYFTEPDKALEGYQRAFAQGSVTDYPLTVRHRDGTLTDLACNASVYRDLNGNVLGVLATGRDVTEQK